MLALYRGGRQADALEAYQAARRTLVDELGVEPGPELQERNRLILKHDATLAAPARVAARAPSDLPTPPTALIGRQDELAVLQEMLVREEIRLITLTGAGGTGKTRLALEAATTTSDAYPDGVFWVSLAPLPDSALVLPTISHVLGARDGPSEHIGTKRLLLALDNLEHLVECGPELSALIASCPNATLLITSREPLRLAGEHEYPVPPLDEPDAVALFVERARQHKPDFEPVDAVVEICRGLDRLPLALELAAARIKVLGVDQILERLAHPLDLLTQGMRDSPARHRTLRATIEWSYQLLSENEKSLFARLTVFPGTFDLEAAEAICDADLDTLAGLVDKSLLREAAGGRFFLLETIREFASKELEESGQAQSLRAAHAAHFHELAAEQAEAAGKGDPLTLDRLDLERDNFRGAFEWAIAARSHGILLSLLQSLHWYWCIRGHGPEGYEWCRRVLESRPDGDGEELRRAYHSASQVARFVGDADWAQELKSEIIQLARSTGDDRTVARATADLAQLATERGDLASARDLANEALEIQRRLGDVGGIANARDAMALIEFHAGNFRDARRIYEEDIGTYERASSRFEVLASLIMIGECLRREGDLSGATDFLRRGLADAEAYGHVLVYPELFQEIAAIAQATGDSKRAAALLGASDRLYEEFHLPVWTKDDREETVHSVRATLGERGFEAARAGGAALETDDALDLARSALD
jgi:predicted ATPase